MESAKEKAKELVDKFYPRATSYASDRKNQIENAKQCALIAVDEIIDSLQIKNYSQADQYEYWNEVKYYIENYE